MDNTSKVNLNITVGEVNNPQTYIRVNAHNSQEATQQVVGQINGVSGANPTSDDVWIRFDGVDQGTLSSLAEEIGLFGAPALFPAGDSVWAKIDLNVVRESIPVPPLSELPIVSSVIEGDLSVQLDISSDVTHQDAIDFKTNKGIPGTFSWLQSFRVNLSAEGQAQGIIALTEGLQPILGNDITEVGRLATALKRADLNLQFSSWNELSDEVVQESIQAGNLEQFITQDIAGMLVQFGPLLETGAQVYLVLNDNLHINISISAPSLVAYNQVLIQG